MVVRGCGRIPIALLFIKKDLENDKPYNSGISAQNINDTQCNLHGVLLLIHDN